MKPQKLPLSLLLAVALFSCSTSHKAGLFADKNGKCPYSQYMYDWMVDSTVSENSSNLELSAGIATMAQTLSKIIVKKDSTALSGLSATYKKEKAVKHFQNRRISSEQYNHAAEQTRQLCNIWETLQNNLLINDQQKEKYLQLLEEIQTSNSKSSEKAVNINQSNMFGNNSVYAPTYNIDPAMVLPGEHDVVCNIDTVNKKIKLILLSEHLFLYDLVRQDFYSIPFRKKLYHSLEPIQVYLNEWIDHYNGSRTHTGKYCFGRTPLQTFEETGSFGKEKQLDELPPAE